MAKPTDETLMYISKLVLEKLSISYEYGGLYLCIEGPLLSENQSYFRVGDACVMTGMPEASYVKASSDMQVLAW